MKIFLLFLCFPINLFSQSFYFLPKEKIFTPIQAGIFESRIGAVKFSVKDQLRLDIGASPEILGINGEDEKYSFGVDFFTFSTLRAEENFKFPVEAIDYFFGVNFNAEKNLSEKNTLKGRLRISHISSHLEDGYENINALGLPFTYSLEFIGLDVQLVSKISNELHIKNQLGVDIVFHSIPQNLSKFIPRYGLEGRYFLNEVFSIYVSNELRFTGNYGSKKLNENLETGISFGELNTSMVNLFFTFYDGNDYRGQFSGNELNYNGLGFNVSF